VYYIGIDQVHARETDVMLSMLCIPHTTCLFLHTPHPAAGEEEGEVVLNAEADHEDDEVPDEAAVAEWAHLQDPGDSPDDVWKVGGCINSRQQTSQGSW
jgi:hypothetical protein